MGNCFSSGERHDVWGEELVCEKKSSTEHSRSRLQLGRGSSASLDQGTRDGVQLLLRPNSGHQSLRPSFRNPVEMPCNPCPMHPTRTSEPPSCQSFTSSDCKPFSKYPWEENLNFTTNPSPSSCPQPLSQLWKADSRLSNCPSSCPSCGRLTCSLSPGGLSSEACVCGALRHSSASPPTSPYQLRTGPRLPLSTNLQPLSKTINIGSLKSSIPPVPSQPASMAQQTAHTRAAPSTMNDTAHEGSQGQPGSPASVKDVRRCKELSSNPRSFLAVCDSPCFEEARLPCPFEQEWQAEGVAGCVGSMAEEPAHQRSHDWTSMHMAMAVAAEQGENMPPTSLDKVAVISAAGKRESGSGQSLPVCSPNPGSSSMDKVASISAAEPRVSNSGHSIPCGVTNAGSSRISHTGIANTNRSSHNSNCSSSTKRSPAALLAQQGTGKLAPPKSQVKVSPPSSSGLATPSTSDPQVPLPAVLSSSLYIPCEECSNSPKTRAGTHGPAHNSTAALSLPDIVVHTSTHDVAQQQQQQEVEYGHVNTHAVCPKIAGFHDRASSPAAARDGHEQLALQSFFRPLAAKKGPT